MDEARPVPILNLNHGLLGYCGSLLPHGGASVEFSASERRWRSGRGTPEEERHLPGDDRLDKDSKQHVCVYGVRSLCLPITFFLRAQTEMRGTFLCASLEKKHGQISSRRGHLPVPTCAVTLLVPVPRSSSYHLPA